jgi:hypothetical protein
MYLSFERPSLKKRLHKAPFEDRIEVSPTRIALLARRMS